MNPRDHSSGFSSNSQDYYSRGYSGTTPSNSNKKNGFFQNLFNNGVSLFSSLFSNSNSNSNNQEYNGSNSLDNYRPNSGNYNDSSFHGNYRNSFYPSTENDFIMDQQYENQMNYGYQRNPEPRNGYGNDSDVYCDTRYDQPIHNSYYQQPNNQFNSFPNSNINYSSNGSFPYRRDNDYYLDLI